MNLKRSPVRRHAQNTKQCVSKLSRNIAKANFIASFVFYIIALHFYSNKNVFQ